jgi:hypothetical protein
MTGSGGAHIDAVSFEPWGCRLGEESTKTSARIKNGTMMLINGFTSGNDYIVADVGCRVRWTCEPFQEHSRSTFWRLCNCACQPLLYIKVYPFPSRLPIIPCRGVLPAPQLTWRPPPLGLAGSSELVEVFVRWGTLTKVLLICWVFVSSQVHIDRCFHAHVARRIKDCSFQSSSCD